MKAFEIVMAAALAAAPLLPATPTMAGEAPAAGDYSPGCAAVAEAERWDDVPPEHQAAAQACLGTVSVLLYAGKELGICPPAPVAQTEAAAVVARHLDRNPEVVGDAFRSVAQDALSEAFPCKVRTP